MLMVDLDSAMDEQADISYFKAMLQYITTMEPADRLIFRMKLIKLLLKFAYPESYQLCEKELVDEKVTDSSVEPAFKSEATIIKTEKTEIKTEPGEIIEIMDDDDPPVDLTHETTAAAENPDISQALKMLLEVTAPGDLAEPEAHSVPQNVAFEQKKVVAKQTTNRIAAALPATQDRGNMPSLPTSTIHQMLQLLLQATRPPIPDAVPAALSVPQNGSVVQDKDADDKTSKSNANKQLLELDSGKENIEKENVSLSESNWLKDPEI